MSARERNVLQPVSTLGRGRLARFCILCVGLCLAVKGTAWAQWDPDIVTLTAPSSAAQCSEIEVVVNSTLTMGHESVTLTYCVLARFCSAFIRVMALLIMHHLR